MREISPRQVRIPRTHREVIVHHIAVYVGGAVLVLDDEVHQHVVRHGHGIEQRLEGRVARSVRIQPLHFHVAGQRGDRGGLGLLPEQVVVGIRAGGGFDVEGVRLDDVPVGLCAAEVLRAEGGIDALFAVIEAPVLAVDVEMIVIAAGGGLAERAHEIARENVADEVRIRAGEIGPRVILRGAQVHHVVLGGAVVAEELIAEFSAAVLVAEEEAEGVLGVVAVAREVAADAKAAVLLEAGLRGVGIDQLHAARALPGVAIVVGIHIDAGGGVEDVGQIRDDAEHGQRL